MDIRLKSTPFEYNGKTYNLTCNFNVLADVQEEFGKIPDITEEKGFLKKISFFIAAMMNDYADDMGWPERVTARQVGRVIDIRDDDLMGNVISVIMAALYAPIEKAAEVGEDSKN